MREDVIRWEQRYQKRRELPPVKPDIALKQHLHLFPDCGVVLDVACGLGDSCAPLLGKGLTVIGIDASQTALRLARHRLQPFATNGGSSFLPLVLDLDTLALPTDHFAAIVILRYLNLDLVRRLKQSVQTHGVFFFLTFNKYHLADQPGFNPAFLLKDGDLQQAFSDWRILEFEENTHGSSYILAKRPPIDIV